MLGLLAWARAELPPPDYRDDLMEAAQAEVARRAREQGMEAAEDFAGDWTKRVGADVRVTYALGLAWRLAGDESRARAALDRAVGMQPHFAPARYDRGEVLLNTGDLPGAQADFEEVVRATPDQWPGHFRLADIAGRRGDAATFERHLVEALRRGFSFRLVVGDPRWHGYLRDATLGPVLRALVEVYQDESVLRALEAPVPGP